MVDAGTGRAISQIIFSQSQLVAIPGIKDMRASLPPYSIACGGPQYLQGGSPSVAKAWLSYVGRDQPTQCSQEANQTQQGPPRSFLTD